MTFVAASGDGGAPGIYPAYSPNVVAAGGTTLTLASDGTYESEIGWSGSGGGISSYEPEPAYQDGVQSTGYRTIPDVSFDADRNTGVAVYDSYDNTGGGPWNEMGGTSLAAPSWAALIAIADQGRVAMGGTTLDGPSQTLPGPLLAPLRRLPRHHHREQRLLCRAGLRRGDRAGHAGRQPAGARPRLLRAARPARRDGPAGRLRGPPAVRSG